MASVLPASDIDLERLARLAGEGDDVAFNRLVEATYTDTWTLALRLVGDPDDANDVVQETYVRVFRSIDRFRGESQLTTWLHRITANCASTFLGRRRRHRHEVLDVDDDDVVAQETTYDPDRSAVRGRLRHLLGEAVASLPPKLRAVVVLYDVYGLPHDVISEELGISVSASKVRLHRARHQLRVSLAESEEVRETADIAPRVEEFRDAV